jgi:hypothetical protein
MTAASHWVEAAAEEENEISDSSGRSRLTLPFAVIKDFYRFGEITI